MADRYLKSGWRRVLFGDVVRQVKDRVDPDASGLERYVAGEHMDSDELRIRRWGTIGDGYLGPAFHMRFKPGHVLYGSRRTYLRKVAEADFDGICANTTFVLEPKDPQTLCPKLLPFLMQLEAFHAHSIRQSRGSVNPYVNFSDLESWEFACPPPDVQLHMAQKLRTIETALHRHQDVANEVAHSLAATIEHYATAQGCPLDAVGQVADTHVPYGWRRHTIRQMCTGNGGGLTLGPFGSELTISDYGHLTEGIPVLFVADVQRFRLTHESKRFVSSAKASELKSHEAHPGDVLITEMGWPPGEACVVPRDWTTSIIKADIIRARPNRDIVLPEYLAAILNSHWGQQQIVRIAPGTTRPRMTLRDFEAIPMLLPPTDVQSRIVDELKVFLDQIAASSARVNALRKVRSLVLERELGS